MPKGVLQAGTRSSSRNARKPGEDIANLPRPGKRDGPLRSARATAQMAPTGHAPCRPAVLRLASSFSHNTASFAFG